MRTIEVEDYIYDFLRQHQMTFTESPSEVLTRLPPLNSAPLNAAPVESPVAVSTDINRVTQRIKDEISRDPRKRALWEFLKSPEFSAERNAVGRFLALLSFLHRDDSDKFARVQSINGRSRKYFGKSESELADSGNSVHPK